MSTADLLKPVESAGEPHLANSGSDSLRVGIADSRQCPSAAADGHYLNRIIVR